MWCEHNGGILGSSSENMNRTLPRDLVWDWPQKQPLCEKRFVNFFFWVREVGGRNWLCSQDWINLHKLPVLTMQRMFFGKMSRSVLSSVQHRGLLQRKPRFPRIPWSSGSRDDNMGILERSRTAVCRSLYSHCIHCTPSDFINMQRHKCSCRPYTWHGDQFSWELWVVFTSCKWHREPLAPCQCGYLHT